MPKLTFLKNPVAALLPAVPGWHALVVEMLPDGTPVWQDAAKTRARVLFMPVTAWGITLPESATKPPSVATLFSGIMAGMHGVLPEGLGLTAFAEDIWVQNDPGFRLLCPPGETFERAIARAEAHAEKMACVGTNSPKGGGG